MTAVQLNLDTEGFTYRKWGGEQRCRPQDWLVHSDSDCYTVNKESFARTYRELSPGRYIKHASVWAEQADESGSIPTKEGSTDYEAGDYLIDNGEDDSDCYAIDKERFEHLYTLIDDES